MVVPIVCGMRSLIVQPLPLLLAVVCALTGCDGSGSIALVGKTTADVRVVNASSTSIDLLENQAVDPGNSTIGFGASSVCMTVDPISHGLSIRPAGALTTATPLASFAANERYVVIATGSAGSLQVTSFRNSFTIASGKAAVRLINAAGSSASNYDIYVTDPGAALSAASASNVAPGTASTYFNVPITAQQIRLTTNQSTVVAFDLGNVTLAAGDRAIVVLAAPAAGGTTLRTFVFRIPSTESC